MLDSVPEGSAEIFFFSFKIVNKSDMFVNECFIFYYFIDLNLWCALCFR